MKVLGSTLIKTIPILVIGEEYETNIDTELKRKGWNGAIMSDVNNTGTIFFAVSANAPGRLNDLGYSGFLPLLPGQSYNLDGMELGSIKIKGTVIGDNVYLEVH